MRVVRSCRGRQVFSPWLEKLLALGRHRAAAAGRWAFLE